MSIHTGQKTSGFGAGRGVFVFDEDTHALCLKSKLFDLRVGYANPILRLGESQRGVREPLTVAKNKGHSQGVSLFFGAGRGIRTPVAFGLTVFKTFRMLPESSRIIPNPPRFSAEFSLFFAPSRKFARKLRETCEKQLKSAPLQV